VASSTAIAGVEIDVAPNNVDDTSAIQAQLTQGNIVRLQPGKTYFISSRLDVVANNSGIITRGTPAILSMTTAFNNIDPMTMFCTKLGVDECKDTRTDSIAIYAESVTDLVLENFKIEKVHDDGTYVAGIWLRDVTRGKLTNLDLSGFSLGAIIALDSVRQVAIRGSTIRDSWASTVKMYNRFPQLTGIWFDDNKIKDANGVPIPSTDVVIANNTIRKLRFKRSLYEMPRNLFAGMEGRPDTDKVKFQTDGITVGPPATNVKIIANVIDVVGEGIDMMGTKVRIEENRIMNSYDCALKFIHGANHSIAYRNFLGAAGYDTICMAGTTMDSVGDTFGNLIMENEITNIGDRTAYCSTNVDPGFSVPCPTGRPAYAMYIQTQPSPAKRPYFNLVQGNKITAGPRMGGLFGVDTRADYSLFYGNVFTNNTGRCTTNVADNNTANCIIITNFDPTAVGTQFDPSADRLAVGDVDGNGLDDFFVHWSASGQNRLYRDMNGTVAIAQDPIPRGAINGSSDRLLSGDFDGDGRTDLLFYWKQTGNNRFYYGTGGASIPFKFEESLNPIPASAINGSPDSTVTGDFDGDHRTDLLFYWKQAGTNRFYYGTGTRGFAEAINPISTVAISGSPDSTVTGDFDGDGRTDLLFHWKVAGGNLSYFGVGRGSFVGVTNPIARGAVNQSPDKVFSFDANFDERDDVDFFWHTNNQRRLYLGQPNRSFGE
jgi:hypothetical protein